MKVILKNYNTKQTRHESAGILQMQTRRCYQQQQAFFLIHIAEILTLLGPAVVALLQVQSKFCAESTVLRK